MVERKKTSDGLNKSDQKMIEEIALQQQTSKKQDVINLSNKKILDVLFVDALPYSMASKIIEIQITKNLISNLDSFNKLVNLKVINASDNYISSVNIHLNKLQELHLRNNFITKVPILHQMPSLRILDLNTNKITELRFKSSNIIK